METPVSPWTLDGLSRTPTEVFVPKSDLNLRRKPQRFLGLLEVRLSEEPRGVVSYSVLSKLNSILLFNVLPVKIFETSLYLVERQKRSKNKTIRVGNCIGSLDLIYLSCQFGYDLRRFCWIKCDKLLKWKLENSTVNLLITTWIIT